MIVPTINRCRWFSMVFPYLPSSMNSYFPFSRHSSSSKNPWFRAGFSGLSGLSSCAFLVAGDFYELPDGANPSLFGRKGSWGGQGQAGMLAKAWLMAVSTSWDSLNVLKPPHLVNMIWNKESTFWEECRDQFTSKNNVHWRIWRVGHDRKTTKKIHDGWSMVGERRSCCGLMMFHSDWSWISIRKRRMATIITSSCFTRTSKSQRKYPKISQVCDLWSFFVVVSVVSHVGSLFLSPGGELAVQWPHLLFGGAVRGQQKAMGCHGSLTWVY